MSDILFKSKQQGAVLIVSLIILLVITLLGAAAIQGTGLEFKMAKNSHARQEVFQATEAVLRRAETNLDDFPYTATQLSSATCGAGDSTCFDTNCAGGLCFFGTNTAGQTACNAISATPSSMPVWDSSHALDIWNAGKYRTFTSQGIDVDYVIEFRCFIDTTSGTVAGGTGDAFYRTTALGADASGRIKVMLQSTYSVFAP